MRLAPEHKREIEALLLGFIFGLAFASVCGWGRAHGAEMCDPAENPYVCVIIEQRDNALADGIKSEGARRMAVTQRAADQAWWKGYLAGEDEQAAKSAADRQALADYWKTYADGIEANRRVTDEFSAQITARMQAACAWKGTMNEPTAQLCAWWKGTGR